MVYFEGLKTPSGRQKHGPPGVSARAAISGYHRHLSPSCAALPTLERETQEDLIFTGPPIAQSPTGTVIPLHMHTQRCLSYEPSGALTLSRPSLSGAIIPEFTGTSRVVFRRKHREHNKRTV